MAEQMLHKVLNINETLFGEKDVRILTALSLLRCLLVALGDCTHEAEKKHRRVVKRFEESAGQDDPTTLNFRVTWVCVFTAEATRRFKRPTFWFVLSSTPER